ncbi:MAG: S8 family serine peptidase [Lachnospiraceae bacterium]|nr:S8 family serine peptidase [Lachnospiraceae bacterium]
MLQKGIGVTQNQVIKVALFDSGVNDKRKEIQKERIIHANTSLYNKDSTDNIGHGTAIAYILQRHLKDVEILSFKLFDTDYETSEKDIISALWDIYENYEDVKLLNISSGATYIENYDQFYDICDKLSSRGCIIVSAFDNEGSISYPAAFDNTIGVYWDAHVCNVNEYFYVDNSNLEILGYSGNQRLPWLSKGYKYVGGSSFIVPYIIAKIAEFIKYDNNITFAQVKYLLRKNAVKVLSLPESVSRNEQKNDIFNVSTINKAIIFPFNKETHALIGNYDLLGFEILGIYDYKFSNKIGKKTVEIVHGEFVKNYIIKDFDKINWKDNFDTIIVGHVDVINKIMKLDFIQEIFEKCLKNKKNVYFFDQIVNYKEQVNLLLNNGNKVMTHYVSDLHITNAIGGSCHKFAMPTLAIVGTSTKQGKYNIQLNLRRRFLKAGYNLGQVGTEPSAHLFGMDIAFSNGYGNQYFETDDKEILYINESIFQLGNKDIILLGTQSNLIPLQFGNLGFLTVHQQNLLIAFEPDCVILCVNYDDDYEYIKRTILVLENYYMTTVLAIVVFPFCRDREWNVNHKYNERISMSQEEEIKGRLNAQFGIETFINGNSDEMDKLCETCISFFEAKGNVNE